jgi:hypothetical protein
MWQDAFVVIGCIGGALGIIQFVYFFGSWKGRMSTMVETMWKIYVEDALSRRPDLATHSSPYKLTRDTENKIPDEVKDRLAIIRCQFPNQEDIVSGFTVAYHLGSDLIEKTSKEMGLGMQETVAVLSTYLENHPHPKQ